MAFKNEINKFITSLTDVFDLKYTLIDGKGVYFENVVKICDISTYRVTLCYKKGIYVVCGNGIYVGKYCDGDLAILGDVERVEKIK